MPNRISISIESNCNLDQIIHAFESSEYTLTCNEIYNIALSYSLLVSDNSLLKSQDSQGREIRNLSEILENQLLTNQIFAIKYERLFTNDELDNLAKAHIDNGLNLLAQYFEEGSSATESLSKLLIDYPQLSTCNTTDKSSDAAINIGLGHEVDTQDYLEICYNAFNNYSMCIVGMPGCGKTQFLQKIITDISKNTVHRTKFIIFDYKGDISTDTKFIGENNLNSYEINEDVGVPISPFILDEYTDKKVKALAYRVSESLASIDAHIGEVQTEYLKTAIERAFAKRTSSGHNFPDFDDIYSELGSLYDEDNKPVDSLMRIISKISDFNLMWEYGFEVPLIEKLHMHSCVINFSKSPVDKEIMGFMILESLYSEMQNLSDSPIDANGKREIRLVLVIDEAHNFLKFENPALEKIIREGRSKGIAIFFASQSASDYKSKSFDYAELLQYKFLFQANNISTGQTKSFLSCSDSEKVNYQDTIQNLDQFRAVFHDPTDNKIKVLDADKFFNSY